MSSRRVDGRRAGRWSQVESALLAARFASPAGARRRRRPARGTTHIDPYPKLFIVGCPRSGTSWVNEIFSMHPAALTTGETHAYPHVWQRVCATGRPRTLRWAAALAKDAQQRQTSLVGMQSLVDRDTFVRLVAEAMGQRDWAPPVAADWVIWRAVDQFLEARGRTDGQVFVEKTPAHLYYAAHLLERFPEARVIEVLRDGRDVCVSMQELAKKRSWPATERATQVQLWLRAVRQGQALRSQDELAERVLLTRFEDLKADPHHEIARMFEFAGVDSSTSAVAKAVEDTRFENKKEPVGTGHYSRKGVVGDWQNHFTDADHELFEEMVGELFSELGYQY